MTAGAARRGAFAWALAWSGLAIARPVTVRVERPDGKPAAGAEVAVYPVPDEVRAVRRDCLGDAACAERALVAAGSPWLREAPPPVDRKTAGAEGAAAFEVPDGDHTVLVRAGDLSALESFGGAHPVALRIVLVRPRRFAAYAALGGKPAAGAEVFAYSDHFLFLARARADAGGRAEVSGPYVYSAMVQAAGGARGYVQSWETPVTLPRPRLCGVVLDADLPAPGAVVWRGAGLPPLNADADGKFCVEVYDEDAMLWAQHGTRATVTTQTLSPARLNEATLHLEEGQRVEGRVLSGDEGGAPVAGARVRVERAAADEDGQESLLETPVRADGSFALDGLPRVGLRLRARADGYAAEVRRWDGKAAELRLRKLHPLAVTVRRRGHALDQAWVEAKALPGSPAFESSGNADAEGRFFFELPAGRYALVAGSAAGSARAVVPEDREVVLETRRRLVELAALRGGLAVEGAVIETVEAGAAGAAEDGASGIDPAEADEDAQEVGDTAEWGRVHIWTDAAPIVFRVSHGGRVGRVEVPAEDAGGEPLRAAELPPLRKVKVIVTRGGKPAPGADVYLVESPDVADAQPRFAGVTDARGTLALETPFEMRLRALKPLEMLRGEAALTVDAPEAAIALEPEGSEVLALDDEGHPMPEVWLPRRGPTPTRDGRVNAWLEHAEEGGPAEAQLFAPGREPSTQPEAGKLVVRFQPCGYLLGSTETEDGRLVEAPITFTAGEDEEPSAAGASSDEGTFRIGCVQAGDAVVRAPGFQAEAHVQVPIGAVGGPVRLRLSGDRWLAVKTGAGVDLTAYRVEDDRKEAEARADGEGAARLGPLRDGAYDVRAEGTHGTQLKRVTVGPSDAAELSLPDRAFPGRIRILPAEGYATTNAVVQAIGDAAASEPLRVGLTDEDGVTVVSGVPAGPRWLELRAKGPEGEAALSTGLYVGAEPVLLRLRAVTAKILELVPEE